MIKTVKIRVSRALFCTLLLKSVAYSCITYATCLSGSVVTSRPDHSSSAPPMLQAAASAAGPPLVASPYPPSYLQYNQVISAMPHYPGQVPTFTFPVEQMLLVFQSNKIF